MQSLKRKIGTALPGVSSSGGDEIDAAVPQDDDEDVDHQVLFEAPEDGHDYDTLVELRFIPAASETLEDIYEAISECSALHASFDSVEEDGAGDFFFNFADACQLTDEGRETLSKLDQMLEVPSDMVAADDGRFADAEE